MARRRAGRLLRADRVLGGITRPRDRGPHRRRPAGRGLDRNRGAGRGVRRTALGAVRLDGRRGARGLRCLPAREAPPADASRHATSCEEVVAAKVGEAIERAESSAAARKTQR